MKCRPGRFSSEPGIHLYLLVLGGPPVSMLCSLKAFQLSGSRALGFCSGAFSASALGACKHVMSASIQSVPDLPMLNQKLDGEYRFSKIKSPVSSSRRDACVAMQISSGFIKHDTFKFCCQLTIHAEATAPAPRAPPRANTRCWLKAALSDVSMTLKWKQSVS